jgi:hypothetical protein
MLCSRRVLAFALANAVVLGPGSAAWCQQPAGAGPLPAEALALPADVGVLAGIDARAVFASAEYKMLMAGQALPGMPTAMPAEVRDSMVNGLKELRDKTGVDLEHDLDRVVVAAGDFAGKEPKFALLALGRFDPARISDAFGRDTGGQTLDRKTVAGGTLLVLGKEGKPDVALLAGDRALLFGTAPLVQAAAADQALGRRPLATNTGLVGLVGRLDPATSIFIAIGPKAIAAMRQASGAQPPPFPLPEAITLAARFGGGFEVIAEMPTEADARNMADVARGGLAALRMRMTQEPQMSGAEDIKRMTEGLEVTAEGRRARLSAAGPTGGVFGIGAIAAIAVPSLLRARVAANEAAAIGDIRTVISAEVAFESTANGYGDLSCLAKPASCLKGYSGPFFIDETLAGATEKNGYKRAFHPGAAGKARGTYRSFAYTATPIEVGKTGSRSFCGDATGRICFDPKGAPIVPASGACPQSCADLK